MQPPLGTELDRLATAHYAADDRSRKSLSYFAEYETILGAARSQPIRLLELGVFHAASMLVFRDYLPNAVIVGLDSGPKPARFPREERVHFVQGQQDDASALAEAVRLAGGAFDLIIDDCSHIARVTKRTFMQLFVDHLRPGGFYVIEDIGTSFLHGVFDDGRVFNPPPLVERDPGVTEFPSHTNGLVGFAKQLVDHAQMDVATMTAKRLPVESVKFISNMAIIHRH
jgi:SAM-dependent methyltransferase